jgi:hypothetical protein
VRLKEGGDEFASMESQKKGKVKKKKPGAYCAGGVIQGQGAWWALKKISP